MPLHCCAHIRTTMRPLQHTTAHCSTRQYTAIQNKYSFDESPRLHNHAPSFSKVHSTHKLQHTATHRNTPQNRQTHGITAHCSTLQHAAARCSRLQQTAADCNRLQYTTSHCSTLHHTAVHCITLQHTASHCITLHHTSAHCSTLQHTAAHCSILQHTAAHCSTKQHASSMLLHCYLKIRPFIIMRTLQHTPTHRNTMQHIAAHCSTQQLQHKTTYSIDAAPLLCKHQTNHNRQPSACGPPLAHLPTPPFLHPSPLPSCCTRNRLLLQRRFTRIHRGGSARQE